MLTLKFVGHFSAVSLTFWEEYVRPESISIDTLGVYCNTWCTSSSDLQISVRKQDSSCNELTLIIHHGELLFLAEISGLRQTAPGIIPSAN